MKELQQIVNEQINVIVTSGSIEQMIAEKLNATIKESVRETMQSYGSFGKSIKSKIEESINSSLSNITIPEYNKFICEMVMECYTQAMNETSKAHIKELLDKHLAPVAKEMTAQQLLEQIEQYWQEDARENDHHKINIAWNRRTKAIYMKAINPEYEDQSIEVTFYNHREDDSNTYHIGYINEDKKQISGCITGATYALGLAGFFYKLYCAQTKITGFDDVYGDDIYVGFD